MKKSRKIECIAVVVALVSAAGLWLAMPDIHRGWYFGFGFIAAAFAQNVLAATAAKKKAIVARRGYVDNPPTRVPHIAPPQQQHQISSKSDGRPLNPRDP